MMKSKITSKIIYGLIFTTILYGLWLRYSFFEAHPLNGDEKMLIHNIKKVFPPIINCEIYGDASCFVGTYVLNYPLIKNFPDNLWLIRIPHISITLLTIGLFIQYCRKRFSSTIPILICIVMFSLNRTLIGHAFELRPYPILPLMALFFLWFWELFSEGKFIKLNQKIFYSIVFLILGGFHPYSLFFIILPLVYFGLTHFKNMIKTINSHRLFFLSLIICGLGSWLFYYLQSKTIYLSSMQPGDYTFHYFGHPLQEPVKFTKNIVGNLLGHTALYLCLPLWTGIFVNQKDLPKKLLFVGILILGGLFCVFYPSYQTGYTFIQRQFIWVMIYFIFFTGWMADELLKAFIKKERT